jgi:hypothetical protein
LRTTRLDALLVVAGMAGPRLWHGTLPVAAWEKWKLALDLDGHDYAALPWKGEYVHVLTTAGPRRPIPGVGEFSTLMATTLMRTAMMEAVKRGWDCSPELSERLATKLDAAEQVVVRHGTAWTWPAAG